MVSFLFSLRKSLDYDGTAFLGTGIGASRSLEEMDIANLLILSRLVSPRRSQNIQKVQQHFYSSFALHLVACTGVTSTFDLILIPMMCLLHSSLPGSLHPSPFFFLHASLPHHYFTSNPSALSKSSRPVPPPHSQSYPPHDSSVSKTSTKDPRGCNERLRRLEERWRWQG